VAAAPSSDAATKPAVLHREPPRSACGKLGVVGRHDHRGPAPRCEPREEVDDLGSGLRVEVPRGLVGEDDPWIGHQRPGDRDPLLLAAREVGRKVRRAVREADLLQQCRRPLAQFVLAYAGGCKRGLDVLERGQGRDQVELLEHEAEGREPQVGELPIPEDAQIVALEQDAAGSGTVERAEQLQQRGLAGPARSLEGDELPGVDLQH
jgi:hypothetical protein